MFRTVLILCGLLAFASTADYCEVLKDKAELFLTEDETRVLNLNTYVKGFDLHFETDNPIATIYSAYEAVSTRGMGSKGTSGFM
jgi:hypothetical protein